MVSPLVASIQRGKISVDEINKTYLHHPSDQLILKPDAAKVNSCTGWVLYAVKSSENGNILLPVMYCSARLPEYMGNWYPCEIKAVGAVLTIDQSAHWINE